MLELNAQYHHYLGKDKKKKKRIQSFNIQFSYTIDFPVVSSNKIFIQEVDGIHSVLP